jgi:outer membrane biogenesis lipoprotein LolB
MARFVVAALGVLFLVGCASQEQIRARQAAAQAAAEAKEDQTCRSYGAQPGTQAYFQCRMTLNQQKATAEAIAEANRQATYSRMMDAGVDMMNGR